LTVQPKARRSSSRPAALLRLAAATIGCPDAALGRSCRPCRGASESEKAVAATARKIAVLFYNILRFTARL